MKKATIEKLILLKEEGKSYIEIAKILNICKRTVSNNLKNIGLTDHNKRIKKLSNETINQVKEFYKTHSLKETIDFFKTGKSTVKKYAKKNKKEKQTITEKRKKMVQHVMKRRRKIKIMAVEYKGGKCVECNYSKTNSALEFHHIDPKEKDFSLSQKGNCYAWEKVKKELDKCLLFCANCHREVHDEINENGFSEIVENILKNKITICAEQRLQQTVNLSV